jgi:hypothetical protein
MKKIIYVISMLFILGAMLLTGIPSAQASQPQAVEITFNLDLTGAYTAAGAFNMSGVIQESGTASQVVRISDDGIIQGKKVLVGQAGTITLRFNAEPTPDGEAFGHFVIVSGTGAYKNIHGEGTTYATFVFEDGVPKIVGTYSGDVHIDP